MSLQSFYTQQYADISGRLLEQYRQKELRKQFVDQEIGIPSWPRLLDIFVIHEIGYE